MNRRPQLSLFHRNTAGRTARGSLFITTFRFMMLSVVLPLLLLSLISSAIAFNFWRSEAHVNGDRALIQYVNAVDNRITYAQQESVRLATDPNVISFILDPGFDDIQRNSLIMKALNDATAIYNTIDSAYLYSHFRKLVLTSEMHGYRYGEMKDQTLLGRYASGDYAPLLVLPADIEQGTHSTIAVYQNVPFQSADSLGCLCLDINVGNLFSVPSDSSTVLNLTVYDQNQDLLFAQDLVDSGYQADPAFWNKIDTETSSFSHRHNQENLIVFHKTSALTGWTFVGTAPMPALSERYNLFSRIMLLLALVAVALSLILSYRMSSRLTRPINTLLQAVNGSEVITPPVYPLPKEYQYVHDAYSKMASEHSNLTDIVEHFRPDIRNNFFFTLLIGEPITQQEITQKLAFFNEGFSDSGYAVIAMVIADYDAYSAAFGEDEKAIHAYQLQCEAEEAVSPEIPCAFLRMNRFTWVLVLNIDDNDLVSRINRRIRGAVSALPTRIDVEAGSVYVSPSDMRYSYREALEKIRFHLYSDTTPSLCAEPSPACSPDTKLEDALVQSVRIGSASAVQSNCKNLFDEMQNLRISPESAAGVARNLTDRILDAQILLGLEVGARDDYYEELEQSTSLPDVKDYILHLALSAVDAIEDYNRSHSGKNIDQLTEYIKNHLSEDISLQTLADACQISPSYVSRLFKEKLNVGFVEYVNSLRVDRARKLLEETQINVEQIGYQVGFNHVRSFIRTFKQYTGMTPGQYRKKKTPPSGI